MPREGTYIKAMVLLLVFSLNTVISFACSLGGIFHAFHHHTSSSSQKKEHNHHQHKENHHQDHDSTSHHHDEKPSGEKDDCCSKRVVEAEKLEKAVSRTIQAPDVIFLTSFLAVYSSLFSIFPVEGKTLYPDNVRWRLQATIQDLRIVIQSFQI